MRARRRVERLERAAGFGFKVAHAVRLDAKGNPLEWRPNDDQIKGIRFTADGQSLVVWKKPCENFDELAARAAANAREVLSPTVFLPLDVQNL